jgi:hypothetical protein
MTQRGSAAPPRGRAGKLSGRIALSVLLFGCSGEVGGSESDDGAADDSAEDSAEDDAVNDGAPGSNGDDSADDHSADPPDGTASDDESGGGSDGAPASAPGQDGAPGQDPEDPSTSANPNDPEDPNAGPSDPANSADQSGPASAPGTTADDFTRLTRAEYANTIDAAFGVVANVNLIPEDGRVGPFTSNAGMSEDPVHAYLLAGEELAAALVPSAYPACETSSALECVTNEYGPSLARLFRRQLTDDELNTWAELVTDLQGTGAPAVEATRSMLAATLISPDFLFRSSPAGGNDATLRRLTERASYALWDAPPDEQIARGPEGDLTPWLQAHAARLSSDERALGVLSRFVAQWLDVDTDLRLEDPAYAMSAEYGELLAYVADALATDAPVTALVAGDRGFIHRDNEDTYRIDFERSGDSDVNQVTWPAESARRGVLGQELLASSTRHPDLSRRPIFRGLLVRRALLCQEIPAPTADLVALAGEVSDRTLDVRCAGCHTMLDPIGEAFAALDPDSDGPIAAEVFAHPELEGTYADLPALLSAIASSRAFAECFASHWLEFFLEQPPAAFDPAWIGVLADSVQSGASLPDLIEQTITELEVRGTTTTPWCEGQ